jgi:hypothetical protein
LLSFLPLPCRTCMVHASVGEVKMVTVLIHSNHLMWLGSWILGWVRSNPTMVGRVRPSKKNICLKFYDFQAFCFKLFCLISVCILCHKTTKNPILKHLVFVNLKKNLKKEKNVFVLRPSVSKLKKNHIVFSYTKKQCFNMHFGFNNQFIKVKRTLTKILKTTKILFCLSFSIRGTTLHVIRILDIKFFFQTLERLGFTPLR